MLWKYYKNIVNVTLFLKFLPRFRQQNFFFSSHFRQWHCHNSIQFFFHFRQCHCHNYQKYFFIFFLFRQWHCRNCFLSTQDTGQEFGQRNFDNSVVEIPLLSLSTFFSFSLLFLLNFGNTIAEILSLSSIPQLTLNSTYKAN